MAATGGDVVLEGTNRHLLDSALDALAATGAEVSETDSGIRVRRDGNGIEISRRQVDQRRTIPVNRRFLPMARSSGVQMSGSAEDLVAKLAGLELGELSFGNIAAVVQRTMQRRPCSDPVTRRLEEAFVKYSAAGGVR